MNRRLVLAALVLGLLTVAVYARTWGFEMLYWDDDVNVLHNPLVQQPNLTGLKRMFTGIFSTDYYPLTYLSLALDHFLWGGRFAGYHVTQTLLHGLNAFLVVLLGYRLTQSAPVALLAGAWFAWHPVQVETVAWVAERKNVLGLGFSLLAWLVYLRARETQRPMPYRLAAAGLFTAAVLSHALVVIVPGLFFAYELTLGRASWREAWRRTWLFFVPAAFAALMRVLGHAESEQLGAQLRHIGEGALTMASVLGQYLTSLVWPVALSNFYVVRGVRQPGDPALWPVALWLALWVVLYWRLPGLRRWTLFAGVWFLVALLPVSQLVPHPTVRADRYLYLAAIAVFVLAALLLERHRAAFAAVTVVSLAGCLWLTWQRLPAWRDARALWTDCLTKNPRAAIGHLGLAGCELRAQNYAAAETHLRRTLELAPDLPEAHELLGAVLLLEGRKDEARVHLRRALELKPGLPDARHNLRLLEASP